MEQYPHPLDILHSGACSNDNSMLFNYSIARAEAPVHDSESSQDQAITQAIAVCDTCPLRSTCADNAGAIAISFLGGSKITSTDTLDIRYLPLTTAARSKRATGPNYLSWADPALPKSYAKNEHLPHQRVIAGRLIQWAEPLDDTLFDAKRGEFPHDPAALLEEIRTYNHRTYTIGDNFNARISHTEDKKRAFSQFVRFTAANPEVCNSFIDTNQYYEDWQTLYLEAFMLNATRSAEYRNRGSDDIFGNQPALLIPVARQCFQDAAAIQSMGFSESMLLATRFSPRDLQGLVDEYAKRPDFPLNGLQVLLSTKYNAFHPRQAITNYRHRLQFFREYYPGLSAGWPAAFLQDTCLRATDIVEGLKNIRTATKRWDGFMRALTTDDNQVTFATLSSRRHKNPLSRQTLLQRRRAVIDALRSLAPEEQAILAHDFDLRWLSAQAPPTPKPAQVSETCLALLPKVRQVITATLRG